MQHEITGPRVCDLYSNRLGGESDVDRRNAGREAKQREDRSDALRQ